MTTSNETGVQGAQPVESAQVAPAAHDALSLLDDLTACMTYSELARFGERIDRVRAALAAEPVKPQEPAADEQEARGEVVVTMNDKGECVCVTRQDQDGQILSVIWVRAATQADPVPGMVLVPEELTERMEEAAAEAYGGNGGFRSLYRAMLAAAPKAVKPSPAQGEPL